MRTEGPNSGEFGYKLVSSCLLDGSTVQLRTQNHIKESPE